MAKKASRKQANRQLRTPAARPAAELDHRRTHPEIVTIVPASCPSCGSASRENYHHVKAMECDGYRITWRNTRCCDCGQRYRTREKVSTAVRSTDA